MKFIHLSIKVVPYITLVLFFSGIIIGAIDENWFASTGWGMASLVFFFYHFTLVPKYKKILDDWKK